MLDYRYYRRRIVKTFKFIIPRNKKILFFGSLDGSILSSLCPSVGVGIEENEAFVSLSRKKYPTITFLKSANEIKNKQKFDFIILHGSLGQAKDFMAILRKIQNFCQPSTRIVVYQHNYMWQDAILFAEKVNWKRHEVVQNWLSVDDVSVYLKSSGFETTRIFRSTLFPLFAFGIGLLINFIATLIPLLDFLKLDQYILARPLPELFPKDSLPNSLTICITVKNEKDNIKKIVKTLPTVCYNQEILFVEGHSTDGTRKEIENMMRLYPKKNIRLKVQPGKGQGDAIRVGFKGAKGEIIILYEGDGTSDPRDLIYFYEAMHFGRFEFIEGSRFVYPLESKAMPFINKLGNIFFAKWFSFILDQRATDVLSGVKAILKRDYNNLYNRWGFLELDDPFGDFELLYGSARLGLQIGEIPMRYYPRTYGLSKTNVLKHGLYLLKMAVKGYLIFRGY